MWRRGGGRLRNERSPGFFRRDKDASRRLGSRPICSDNSRYRVACNQHVREAVPPSASALRFSASPVVSVVTEHTAAPALPSGGSFRSEDPAGLFLRRD